MAAFPRGCCCVGKAATAPAAARARIVCTRMVDTKDAMDKFDHLYRSKSTTCCCIRMLKGRCCPGLIFPLVPPHFRHRCLILQVACPSNAIGQFLLQCNPLPTNCPCADPSGLHISLSSTASIDYDGKATPSILGCSDARRCTWMKATYSATPHSSAM